MSVERRDNRTVIAAEGRALGVVVQHDPGELHLWVARPDARGAEALPKGAMACLDEQAVRSLFHELALWLARERARGGR